MSYNITYQCLAIDPTNRMKKFNRTFDSFHHAKKFYDEKIKDSYFKNIKIWKEIYLNEQTTN